MKSKQEVERFLEDIKIRVKSGILNILYLNDREKNARTLLELEIPGNKRTEIIMKLQPEDFYRVEEGKYLEQFEMFSFGKTVKGKEVYIKFSVTDKNLICISFHKAEYPIIYPYK
ncbi:MAG: toxin [Bacteroidota bacterium]|jgi:hypothetical protein|nr:toxin [Bacteroidota bacterium]HHU97378.1 type II toxin-antitoxin system MqsR family toxin [Petrimonas sp.]